MAKRQEKKKSLTRRIIELFQSRSGYTSTPQRVSIDLKSNYDLTKFIMKKLEGDDMKILYSLGGNHQIYSIRPIHLWKKTIKQARELVKKDLKKYLKLYKYKSGLTSYLNDAET